LSEPLDQANCRRSIAPGSPPINSIQDWPGAGDIPRGWLGLHESGTVRVKLTQSGADLFA
jgi:hypothetical protein